MSISTPAPPNGCAHRAEARERVAAIEAQLLRRPRPRLRPGPRPSRSPGARPSGQRKPRCPQVLRAPGNAGDDGKTFSDRAAQELEAIRSSTGLVYRALREGTGPSPKPTDRVKVRYRGTLTNGQEFENSERRGGSDEFQFTEVQPCWTEGLQYMKAGGEARLVCPPDLVYVEPGAGNVVPPNATLIFDVELLGVSTPNGAKTDAAQSDVSL